MKRKQKIETSLENLTRARLNKKLGGEGVFCMVSREPAEMVEGDPPQVSGKERTITKRFSQKVRQRQTGWTTAPRGQGGKKLPGSLLWYSGRPEKGGSGGELCWNRQKSENLKHSLKGSNN